MPSGGTVPGTVALPRPRACCRRGAGTAVSAARGIIRAAWAGVGSAAAISATGIPAVIPASVSTTVAAAASVESTSAGVHASTSARVTAAMLGRSWRAKQYQRRGSREKRYQHGGFVHPRPSTSECRLAGLELNPTTQKQYVSLENCGTDRTARERDWQQRSAVLLPCVGASGFPLASRCEDRIRFACGRE